MSKSQVVVLRSKYDKLREELSKKISETYPAGTRCAILRERNGSKFRIYGRVAFGPWPSEPTRLGIKTDKRGTIMWADCNDLECHCAT